MTNTEKIYIDKYIAEFGQYSRRKAQELVSAKKVLINGKIAKLNNQVNESDTILIDNQLLKPHKKQIIVIAYNKPKGIICTTEKIKDNIVDAIAYPEKIYPIGRLDKDSEGLILLTNHNTLIDAIANPKFEHEKEYMVTLNLPVRTGFIKAIEEGINIGIGITKPAKAKIMVGTRRVLIITLTQGLNRQIRKMCNVHNYQVLKLQRIRIMNIQLNDLSLGKWRYLDDEEIKCLLEVIKR